jgi:hypothetical protein
LIGWEGKRVVGLLGFIIDGIDVDDNDGFVRKEVVGSLVEHTDDEVAHNWLCLDINIVHHGVDVPSSQHYNVIHIHVDMEQCHGSSRAQGSGADLHCINADAVHVQARGIAGPWP